MGIENLEEFRIIKEIIRRDGVGIPDRNGWKPKRGMIVELKDGRHEVFRTTVKSSLEETIIPLLPQIERITFILDDEEYELAICDW
jgi:hypothetical protein